SPQFALTVLGSVASRLGFWPVNLNVTVRTFCPDPTVMVFGSILKIWMLLGFVPTLHCAKAAGTFPEPWRSIPATKEKKHDQPANVQLGLFFMGPSHYLCRGGNIAILKARRFRNCT